MSQDINPPNEPPEGGYGNEGYQPGQGGGDFLDTPEDPEPILTQQKPAVAAAQNRIIVILIVVMGIVGVLLFVLFGQNKEMSKEEMEANRRQSESVPVAAPVETPNPLPSVATPDAPTPAQPDSVSLPPPPLPFQETVTTTPTAATPTGDSEADIRARQQAEEMRQRQRRSNMTISNGGGARSLLSNTNNNISSENGGTPKDSNLQYARTSSDEAVSVVTAEKLKNLDTLIAQGKIVDAVLESAINTDLPAPIRAIVSRDVYAEAGHEVLIPKGSRIIGKYNTSLLSNQKRVYIIWTRVMRPDGVVIAINSPGIDQIGRGGVEGLVDNHYLELYSSAILTSLLTVGTAVAGDAAIGGDVSTTSSSFGSTTSGSAGAIALQTAVNNLGDTTQSVVKKFTNLQPTIMLDQGTRVNIFVNHDLTFPQNIVGGPQVLQ